MFRLMTELLCSSAIGLMSSHLQMQTDKLFGHYSNDPSEGSFVNRVGRRSELHIYEHAP